MAFNVQENAVFLPYPTLSYPTRIFENLPTVGGGTPSPHSFFYFLYGEQLEKGVCKGVLIVDIETCFYSWERR